eukprot:SAG31_NODE_7266_length_1737_cov_9.395604_1_plen_78_part_10
MVRDAGREHQIVQEIEPTYCAAFMMQSEEVRPASGSNGAPVTDTVTVLNCYRSYDTSKFIHREVVLDTGCDSTICHTQ